MAVGLAHTSAEASGYFGKGPPGAGGEAECSTTTSTFHRAQYARPTAASSGGTWAPLCKCGHAGNLRLGRTAGIRHAARGRRLFRPSASAGGGRIALCLSTGGRPRVSRPRFALAAAGRTSSRRRCSFPSDYRWSDGAWRGIAREDLVIYELHVGTFTPEGTFEAIVPRLPELLSLGVTAIELMPVAQFAGDRNWGYDGVYPYAVQNSYGGPRALQAVCRRRPSGRPGRDPRRGLQPLRLGGKLPAAISAPISPIVTIPLGQWQSITTGRTAMRCGSSPSTTPRMWVRDYHLDGLRLDAVQTIYDLGARHILAEIQDGSAAGSRPRASPGARHRGDQPERRAPGSPPERGGYGLDAVWADDFHHSVHALLTGERDGYYADFGRAEARCQGLQRRVRVRRLLQHVPPPPSRQPSRRDRPHAVRRLHPEPRPGGEPRPRRPLGLDRGAVWAAPGVRPAAALALRAVVVHGRGIWRGAAVSVFLLVRRSRNHRGGAARPPPRIRRPGIPVEDGDSRSAGSRHVRRRQTRLGMAGGLAAGAAPATLSGSAPAPGATGRHSATGGTPRPGCSATRIGKMPRKSRPCSCSNAAATAGILAVANLATTSAVDSPRSTPAAENCC